MKKTFKHFINESMAFDFDKFVTDCKPFLDTINGMAQDRIAVHGSKNCPVDWQMLEVHRRTGPKDSPRQLHDAANDFFEERFGWRAREDGIFVSGARMVAQEYGSITAVFPVGEFKSLWSDDVEDLTSMWADTTGNYIDISSRDEDWAQKVKIRKIETVVQNMKSVKWEFNAKLPMGLRSGNEIILGAKKMYQFNVIGKTYAQHVLPALIDAGIITK